MKKGIRSFVAFSLLGLVLFFPRALPAEGDSGKGKISGIINNGTDGKRVAGAKVTLKNYDGDQEKDRKGTISDQAGNYSFSGLEKGPRLSYVVQAVYKGVEYLSDIMIFGDGKQEISYNVTVYDTTNSNAKISVKMHHLVIEPTENAFWVRELMILQNRDNRVYVGGEMIRDDKKETLRISLPPQARDIQLTKGLQSAFVVKTERGMSDTLGIKPGRKEILFAYKINYGNEGFNLSKKITLATDSLDFFVPKGIPVQGKNVQYAGLIGESGKEFAHFSGKNLSKGATVGIIFERLGKTKKSIKGLAVTIGVVIVGLGLAYPLIRRRKRTDEIEGYEWEVETEEESPEEERTSLLMAMAELDDQLDAGEISEEEHDKKRRALKEKVIEVTRAGEGDQEGR